MKAVFLTGLYAFANNELGALAAVFDGDLVVVREAVEVGDVVDDSTEALLVDQLMYPGDALALLAEVRQRFPGVVRVVVLDWPGGPEAAEDTYQLLRPVTEERIGGLMEYIKHARTNVAQ